MYLQRRVCASRSNTLGLQKSGKDWLLAILYDCMTSARRPDMPHSTGSPVEFPLTSIWIDVAFCWILNAGEVSSKVGIDMLLELSGCTIGSSVLELRSMEFEDERLLWVCHLAVAIIVFLDKRDFESEDGIFLGNS